MTFLKLKHSTLDTRDMTFVIKSCVPLCFARGKERYNNKKKFNTLTKLRFKFCFKFLVFSKQNELLLINKCFFFESAWQSHGTKFKVPFSIFYLVLISRMWIFLNYLHLFYHA